ncbi:hypothetical protein E3P90_04139 [Wallemia ichthyophaga]|uniref:Integrase catalytic domain-containing protein n=1 Tax=Wallemia ichthyophaga TaxID=245174 RepID=A0A4T0GX32_WALIC|nr:hypothetical protein E3P90_04139 [Wallemia ichthyophaga]
MKKEAAKTESCYLGMIQEEKKDGDKVSDRGIEKILRKYEDVFPSDLPVGLPKKRSIEHQINLKEEHIPPSRSPYRLSWEQNDELKKQLRNLIEKQHIEPSISPYGAPVMFVKKSDGTMRMSKIFQQDRSKIRVRINEKDIEKTGFNTKYGHFQFKVMPFGLCNAPGTFQYLMQDIFKDELDQCVAVYIDDILIFSRTYEEHLKHLDLVLRKLKENQLYGKLSKCEFAMEQVEFLGYVINQHGVQPRDDKVRVVMEWPKLNNVTEVQSFMGFVQYYRKFIQDLSQISLPLTELTKKNNKFVWGEKQQKSFDTLKGKLASAPVLKIPTRTGKFKVTTDASGSAVGAVLEQEENGETRPVAYLSQKLNGSQLNWSIRDKELYAIIVAITKWKHYLLGRSITVNTDHKTIETFRKAEFSSRVAKWSEIWAEYDIEVKYKPGKDNKVADALSRKMELNTLDLTSIDETFQNKIRRDYQEDTKIKEIIEKIQNNDDNTSDTHKIREGILTFSAQPGDLDEERVVLPKGETRDIILHDFHDAPVAGHLGTDKTHNSIARHYYWPRMYEDIKRYVSSCGTCQVAKASTRPPGGLARPLPIPQRKWDMVGIDLITKLPKTRRGHTAILVVVDHLSKRGHFIATKDTTSGADIAYLYLANVFRHHGLPKIFIHDRDVRFRNFWRQLHELLGIQLRYTSGGHPETNGQVERTNKTLEQYIRSYTNNQQTNWDSLLPLAEFSYNDSKHDSTGIRPFYFEYGQNVNRPGTITHATQTPSANGFASIVKSMTTRAKDNLRRIKDYNSNYTNQSRREENINIGDMVYIHNSGIPSMYRLRTDSVWLGPFRVLDKWSTAYRVELRHTRAHNVFHASYLKKANIDRPQQPTSLMTRATMAINNNRYQREDDDQLYRRGQVQNILSITDTPDGTQYLVQWQNQPISDATWVDAEALHEISNYGDVVTRRGE